MRANEEEKESAERFRRKASIENEGFNVDEPQPNRVSAPAESVVAHQEAAPFQARLRFERIDARWKSTGFS